MTFNVAAEAYDSFMGRYSTKLAPLMVDLAGVRPGQRVLDVGCGPGALTGALVPLLGSEAVAAIDPSEPFVEAARLRFPGVDVRRATAEQLPFGDRTFDAALAQLVVHFMQDPVRGIREMARVTRRGGVIAACVWDHAGRRSPVSRFWDAASELDPNAPDESDFPGAREGDLRRIFREAGLREVLDTELTIRLEHATFEEWWRPLTLGVGPLGAYVRTLSAERLGAVLERCRATIGDGPLTITAVAWAARGIVPAAHAA